AAALVVGMFVMTVHKDAPALTRVEDTSLAQAVIGTNSSAEARRETGQSDNSRSLVASRTAGAKGISARVGETTSERRVLNEVDRGAITLTFFDPGSAERGERLELNALNVSPISISSIVVEPLREEASGALQ